MCMCCVYRFSLRAAGPGRAGLARSQRPSFPGRPPRPRYAWNVCARYARARNTILFIINAILNLYFARMFNYALPRAVRVCVHACACVHRIFTLLRNADERTHATLRTHFHVTFSHTHIVAESSPRLRMYMRIDVAHRYTHTKHVILYKYIKIYSIVYRILWTTLLSSESSPFPQPQRKKDKTNTHPHQRSQTTRTFEIYTHTLLYQYLINNI